MNAHRMDKKDSFTIATNSRRKNIIKNDVVSCKGYSFGTRISVFKNKHYLMNENLNELQNILDTGYFCMMNSYTIINILYIDAIFNSKVVLKNGEEYDISYREKEKLIEGIKEVYAI